jgi:cohesin complex subunit SCC1
LDFGIGAETGGGREASFELGRERGRSKSAGFNFGARAGSMGMNSLKSADMGPGAGMDFGPVDLGLDFGDISMDQADADLPLPNLERGRRESAYQLTDEDLQLTSTASALSTPPPVSPPQEAIAEIVGGPNTVKVKRPRLLQADDQLELPDDQFAAPNRDNSSILGEERYLPSDPEIIRLQAIAADPNSHFLPTMTVDGKAMIFAGPEGLAPELAAMFAFPADILRRNRDHIAEEERAAKRPRVQESEQDVEAGRRGSRLPSEAFGGGMFGDADNTFEFGPQDDFNLPMDENVIVTPRAKRQSQVNREKEPSLAASRAESIARQIQFGGDFDPEHPLAMFDARFRAEGETQSLNETPVKSSLGGAVTETSRTTGGYSKHTGMAMGLLRRELEAIEDEDKVVHFDQVADKVSSPVLSLAFD